jgi:hypothetical protein
MKVFFRLLIVLIFLCFPLTLFGQFPNVQWFKAQGTSSEEHVHEGMQTSDGGYIAIGHGIETADADDMLIIKVDGDGNFEWKQEFGTAGKKGAGYCITEIADGYIAGGAIYNEDSIRTQRFLARLDFSGNIVWQKFYASQGIGGIRGIDNTSDGGIVVTGYSNTPNISEFRGFVFIVDDGDGFIMKLDLDGIVQWEKLIDAPQGTKVREIEGGFIVCSTIWTWNAAAGDHQDFCLIKTDASGETIWRKLYGGNSDEHCYDFDLTHDRGFILAGHTLSYGVENWDYLLMKIDSSGTESWHKTFGQPRGYDAQYIHDEAYGVRQTADLGFIIAGGSGDEYSYSSSGHPAGPSDEWKVYLVKTDPAGNSQWQGVYPANSVGNNAGEYISLTDDNGYMVFVDTDSKRSPAPNNFGFMKIESGPATYITEESLKTPDFILKQNYPNPFNPQTIISYTVGAIHESPLHVSLKIYDISGREIKTLVNSQQPAAEYSVQFNPGSLSSGIFIGRLQTEKYTSTIKMLYIK